MGFLGQIQLAPLIMNPEIVCGAVRSKRRNPDTHTPLADLLAGATCSGRDYSIKEVHFQTTRYTFVEQ